MSVNIVRNIRTIPAELLRFSITHKDAAFYLSKSKLSHTSPNAVLDCYSHIRFIGEMIKRSNFNIDKVESALQSSIHLLFPDMIFSSIRHKSILLALLHPSKRLGFGYKKIDIELFENGTGSYKHLNLLTEKRLLGKVRVGGKITVLNEGKLVTGRISDINSILVKGVVEDEVGQISRSEVEKAEQEENEWFHNLMYMLDHGGSF